MRLTFSQNIVRQSERAFTLVEAMIAAASLVIVLGSVVACNLFGISMAARQHIWLGATEDAAKSVSTLMEDIRSATCIQVGTYSNNIFVPASLGAQQSGNALAISTNEILPVGNFPWTNSWTLYYYDYTSNFLVRSNFLAFGSSDFKLVSTDHITNDPAKPIFTEVDYNGNALSNQATYLPPVSICLTYTGLDDSVLSEAANNFQKHYTPVGTGNTVDHYQLIATVTPRTGL